MINMESVKKKRNRKSFIPTDRQRGMVLGMALWNTPLTQICEKIIMPNGKPIGSVETLKKIFKSELEEAFTNIETNIATVMYKRSLKEGQSSQRAGEFLLKCKFGWREATEPEDSELIIKGGLPEMPREDEEEGEQWHETEGTEEGIE